MLQKLQSLATDNNSTKSCGNVIFTACLLINFSGLLSKSISQIVPEGIVDQL